MEVEDDVKLAHILEVPIERLNEDLLGTRETRRWWVAAGRRPASGGEPTWIRSRIPSSLSLPSIAMIKYSVAYCRYTIRAPGLSVNHFDASMKLHTPSGRAPSTLNSSFTMSCCCFSACTTRAHKTLTLGAHPRCGLAYAAHHVRGLVKLHEARFAEVVDDGHGEDHR